MRGGPARVRARRIAAWLLRATLWSGVILVALIAAGLLFLHSQPGRAWVRDKVVAALDNLLAGQISIGRIEGSVLDRFSLHDVEVRDDRGELAIRVDELILDTDLWELAQQRVAVDVVILERLQVMAKVRADGSLNLGHVIEPQPEAEEVSPWIVSLDRVAVHDGAFTFREAGVTSLHVDDIDIETRVVTGRGDTRIELEHLNAFWREGERSVFARAGVDIHGSALTARAVELRLGGGWLNASHAYHDWERGSLLALAFLHLPAELAATLAPDLGLASDVDLSLAVARVHESWPMWLAARASAGGGKARVYGWAIPEQPALSLRVAGDGVNLASILPGLPRTMLDLRARVSGQGASLETLRAQATLALRGRVEDQPITDLRLRAAVREQRAEVRAGVRIPAGTLDVDGAVDLGPEVPVLDDVRVRAALDSIADATAAIPELPGEIGVQGEAEVDVRVTGPVDALAIAGTISGSGLRWRDVQVETLGLEMDLRGLPGRVQGSARLVATDVIQVDERYGDVQARVTSAGAPGALAVELRVTGPNALVPMFVAATVRQDQQGTTIELDRYQLATAHVAWRGRGGAVRIDAGGTVQVRDIALRSRAGQVAVASALIAGSRMRGAVRLDRIDLAEIGRVLERVTGAAPLPMIGHVSVDARLDRRGTRVTGTVALAAEDLTPAPHVVAGAPAGADPSPASAPGSVASSDTASEAGASSEMDTPSGRRAASGRPLPPVDVTAELTLARDDLDLTVRAGAAALGQARLSASVRPPRDVTSVRAWQALDERAVRALALHVAGLDLARLRDLAPAALGPLFSGEVAGDVSVGQGADSARVAIRANELRIGPVGEPMAFALEAGLGGRLLRVDGRVDVPARGQAELHATAELPARLTRAAAWRAMDRRALRGAHLFVGEADLDYWLALAGIESDLGARASLAMSATDVGRSADIDAHVAVPARPALGLPASDLELAAELTRGTIDAELAVFLGGQRYLHGDARWRIGLDALLGGRARRLAAAPARVDVTLDGLPLALVGQLLSVPARLAGEIRGRARLRGSLARPDLAVDLRSDGAVLAGSEFESMALHGVYRGQRARLVIDGVQARGGVLDLDALVRLAGAGGPTGEVALRAERFDIAFLGDLIDELDIGGVLDANLTIQGSARAPVARGFLHLREGSLHTGPPLRSVHEAEIRIELEKDRVWLRRASARAGRGRVALSGSAELDGLLPRTFQLRLDSRGLPLELGTKVVSVDADLRVIDGRRTRRGWSADVLVKRALIRLPDASGRELHDVDLPDDVVFVDGRCVGRSSCAETLALMDESGEALAPVGAPVPVRITIRARDTIEVRSDEARVIVGARLVVDTRSGDLDVDGSIIAGAGYVELFGRRYQVRRAVASFGASTADVPDPSLDILLAHEFSTLTLFLQVQGTASRPELVLSSEPGIYDDATLLSFVLGADPDSPADGVSPGVRERAVGVASGLIMGQVQGLVQEVLPIDIDVLRVELAESSASAERLVVGKWITDELFLSYSHNFIRDPNENSGEASLEYRLRKRWLLAAHFGDRGAGGLDLLWTKRF